MLILGCILMFWAPLGKKFKNYNAVSASYIYVCPRRRNNCSAIALLKINY